MKRKAKIEAPKRLIETATGKELQPGDKVTVNDEPAYIYELQAHKNRVMVTLENDSPKTFGAAISISPTNIGAAFI